MPFRVSLRARATLPARKLGRLPEPGERGIALVMALLVLTTLAIIVLSLTTSISATRRVASDEVTKAKALRGAESGVAEALNRIQNGLGPNPSAASPWLKVVQVINATSPGTAGTDTTLLATGQPNGAMLSYSTATKGPLALTIDFLTDAARTKLYKYDKTLNPPLQFTSGSPVYRITSVGRAGNISRRLVVQCIGGSGSSSGYNILGAVVSGTDIKYTGSGYNCGLNHLKTTPYPAGTTGSAGASGCAAYHTGVGDMPGVCATGNFSKTGSSVDTGSPSGVVANTGTFYSGPWEIFGITQSAFFTWVGAQVSKPAVLNGVYYVDNDGIPQNRSYNISYAGAITGSGLLYVDGDLTLNNNFHFTGLVYCEGKLTASNSAWVLGAIVCRGPAGGRNDMTGPNTFLYSDSAIANIPGAPAVVGAKMKVLSWKED